MVSKVSVIIPVYNVLSYLQGCLDSVVNQTHKDLEIILIDDGSTDGSGAICDRWGRLDSRVQVIHQTNQGLSAARNRGLKAFTGGYVTFVDSDDQIAPEMVQVLLQDLETATADIACTDMVVFDEPPPVFKGTGAVQVGLTKDLLPDLLYRTVRWSACGKLYRRDLFANGLGFQMGKLYEDVHFTPQVFLTAERVVCGQHALYGYCQREASIMGQTQRVISPDLITMLTLNMALIDAHYTDDDPRGQQLRALMAIHPGSRLHRIREWTDENQPFIQAYQTFVRRYWPQLRDNPYISRKRRLGLYVSMFSMKIFYRYFR